MRRMIVTSMIFLPSSFLLLLSSCSIYLSVPLSILTHIQLLLPPTFPHDPELERKPHVKMPARGLSMAEKKVKMLEIFHESVSQQSFSYRRRGRLMAPSRASFTP